MAQITKHHSKEEWEGNNCKNSRVDFFMHRNSICVDDLLENFSKFIRFDIGGRLYAVIFGPLKICRSKYRQALSDLLLLLTWTPEIAYVGSFILPHQIKAVIDCSFFGYKPFVDLEAASDLLSPSFSARNLTDLNEIVFELLFGSHGQVFRLQNISLDLLNLLVNLINGREIKSLSHKRVADTDDFISH